MPDNFRVLNGNGWDLSRLFRERFEVQGAGFMYRCTAGAVVKRKEAIKKPSQAYAQEGFVKKVGDDLLSHTVARAVPSALESLTSVFGMGTGGTSPLWSPKKLFFCACSLSKVIK